MTPHLKRKLKRYQNISDHLVHYGSGIDAIDLYIQKKIRTNNGFWIAVISLSIIFNLIW